jgi:hypothetical protein
VRPPPSPARSRPIKLSDQEAARIASADLGRRVPASTIRSWKHRDEIAGGRGWIDGESLLAQLERVAGRLTPGDRPCATP